MWNSLIAWMLLACGSSEQAGEASPSLDLSAPMVELDGAAPVVVSPPSNGHGGLSLAGVRVQALTLWNGTDGRLHAAWREPDALRTRAWDGQNWTDERHDLRDAAGDRIRPADWAWTGDGVAVVGGGPESVERLPPVSLRLVGDGEPRVVNEPPAWKTAVDPQGRTVVVHFAGPTAMVHRMEDGEWQTLGGPAEARGYVPAGRLGPAIAFDASDNPVVAWRQSYTVMPRKGEKYKRTRWRTWVQRWTGEAWEWLAAERSPLDEAPPAPKDGDAQDAELKRKAWENAQSQPPRLAVVGDAVFVAWPTVNGFAIWRHQGDAWSELDSPVDLPGPGFDPVLYALDDTLYVAWSHAWRTRAARAPREIQVRAWGEDGWFDPAETGREGASDTPGPSSLPVLGRYEDRLVVAWLETTSGEPEVYVATLVDGAWVGLPDGKVEGGLGEGDAAASEVAIWANADRTRVASLRSGDRDRLVVTDSADGAWTDGPSHEVEAGIHRAMFASGESGQFWAAYESKAPEAGLFVVREGEQGWTAVGSAERGLTPDASGRYPFSMRLDASGLPWVVWTHNGRAPQVRQYDGGRWVIPDRLSGGSTQTFPPRLAFADGGRAVVLWSGASSNRDVDLKVALLDDSGWSQIGTDWWLRCDANLGGGAPVDADVAVDGRGRPVVAWVQRAPSKKNGGAGHRILSCRWDGQAWTMLPQVAEATDLHDRSERRPSVRLGSVGGTVMVSWTQGNDPQRQVYAQVLKGDSWAPLGPADGQVSTCESGCFAPAIGEGQRLCLGWEEMGQRAPVASVACAEP